jgi:rubredoxin
LEKNYQCSLCGHYYEGLETPPTKCSDCGCPMIREVARGTMDSVSPEAVAHIRKKMENCPNYDSDPKSGAQSYHKLELVREIDTSRANPKLPLERTCVQVRQRCKHCGLLYAQASIPLSRRDTFERLGILSEVQSKIPGWGRSD